VEGSYDCVITDIHLPGMSGFDLKRLLASRHSKVPVIIITARTEPHLESRAAAGGVAYLLRKPFETSTLINGLENAIAFSRDPKGDTDRTECGRESGHALAQGLEGAKLVERVEGLTLDILGQRVPSAMPSVRTTQGTAWVLFMRFCVTSNSSARNRRSPAGTSKMPVS